MMLFRFLLTCLLIALPFHSVFIDGVISKYLTYINYWKELVCFLIFGLVFDKFFKTKNQKVYHYLFIFIGYSLYVAVHTAYNFESYSLQSIRTYILPGILFFSILLSPVNLADYERVKSIYIFVSAVSVCYALFQVHVLGDSFLLNIGFPPNEWDSSKLKFSFYVHEGEIQRANAGFSGPIIFALFLVPAIIISYERFCDSKSYLNLFLLLLISVGMLSTMLRSALLAFCAIILIYYFNRSNLKVLIFSALAFSAIGLLSYSLMPEDSSIRNTIYSFLSISTGGYDPSKIGHFNSFVKGLEIISQNPFLGSGIGSHSPASSAIDSNIVVLESTFLSLISELGLIGFTFFIAFFIMLFRDGVYDNFLIRKMLVAFFIIGFFLPLHYYFEVVVLYVILIATNLKIRFANNV